MREGWIYLMNNEKISVIIPTYKRCDGLKHAIESVLHQSYPNIEIIVVDDNVRNSPERQQVAEIMKGYTSHEEIKYIQQPDNKGGSAARNAGIRAATGTIIAFLDDDDQYLEHYLKLLHDKMVHGKFQMVFLGNYYKFDGQYTYVKKRKYEKESYGIHDVLNGECLISIFFIIRKDFILQSGLFDESLRGYQDCDMWINISSQTAIGVVEEPLAICNRDGGERVTSNILQREQALNVLTNKWRGVMKAEDRQDLELFYSRQMVEFEKQKENERLFNAERVKFNILYKALKGNYSWAQKIKLLLIFLFGKNGQKIYRWLQFEVFNSKLTFWEKSNNTH